MTQRSTPVTADRFPIGSHVTMSETGAKTFPAYAGKQGKVLGYKSDVSIKILFKRRTTASRWHPDFLVPLNGDSS